MNGEARTRRSRTAGWPRPGGARRLQGSRAAARTWPPRGAGGAAGPAWRAAPCRCSGPGPSAPPRAGPWASPLGITGYLKGCAWRAAACCCWGPGPSAWVPGRPHDASEDLRVQLCTLAHYPATYLRLLWARVNTSSRHTWSKSGCASMKQYCTSARTRFLRLWRQMRCLVFPLAPANTS